MSTESTEISESNATPDPVAEASAQWRTTQTPEQLGQKNESSEVSSDE